MSIEPAPPKSDNPDACQVASPKPADHSKSNRVRSARAKRALNRGEFREAELLLREVIALDPKSTDAHTATRSTC